MAHYRYSIVDYVDKDLETYVQGRGKLSRHCTSRSDIESIHTKSRMKGRGSHELVEESDSHVLDSVYEWSLAR